MGQDYYFNLSLQTLLARHSNSISRSGRRLAPKSGTEKAAYRHPSARTCFAFSAAGGQQPAGTIGTGVQTARDAAALRGGLAPCAVAVPSVWHWRGVPVFPCTPSPAARGVKAGGRG